MTNTAMRKMAMGTGVFLALFCLGCATQVVGVVKAPDFKGPVLNAGGMAIGGVVDSQAPLGAGTRDIYARTLMSQVQSSCKKLRITPVEQVRAAVGQAQYENLLTYYRQTASIPPQPLKNLAKALEGTRFVVFGRVEQDIVQNSNQQDTNPITKYNKREKKDVTVGETITDTYYTTRHVTATFNVYDLETLTSAWSGTVDNTLSRNNAYSRNVYNRESALDTLAKGVVAGALDGPRTYPPPAPLQEAMMDIFHGFAKKMPTK